MDSKKLEMLVTAIDLGSFTKASEVVGYTQSGLTHMMDSLENEIGFPIIERGHGGVVLNENGQALMPLIRDFLKANSNLDNKISDIKQKGSGTIRVAAYASIAMHWLPQILYSFRRVCPDVEIDLRMVDNALQPFELLEEGKTDVAFASRQSGFKCEWIPLYKEQVYAILPKDWNTKGLSSFPLSGFNGKDFLMPYGKFDIDVNRAFEAQGVKANIKAAKVDDETVIRMVSMGLGVTMMAELMLRGRTGNVKCLPVSPATYRELGMGIRPDARDSYAIRSLIDCVLGMSDSFRKG